MSAPLFRIVKERRAWWPVVWAGALEEGGVAENRIELRFRLVGEDEAREITRRSFEREAELGEGAAVSVLRAGLVAGIASDWRGVGAENGEALPWSEENLRLLIDQPGVWEAALAAYADARAGRAEARAGN